MEDFGLYIHIPFCKKKCYYCDFYSIECHDENYISVYLDRLDMEIKYFFERFNVQDLKITTVYIGGGTPSLLGAKQFLKLFNTIKRNFLTRYLKEITVECNPESIDEYKLMVLKDIALDLKTTLRVSLGIQSFNEKILKNLGRIHNLENILKSIEIIYNLSIENYNFDLMFGCPQQTFEDFKTDLEKCLLYNPKHISTYALSIDKEKLLQNEYFKPNEDLQADMYLYLTEYLTKRGYIPYEISNFALPGYECLHNKNYWFYKEYVGFGPSAVSFYNLNRIKNKSEIKQYLEGIFVYDIENITEDVYLKEKIMLGLRTKEGVELTEDIKNKYSKVIEKLLKENKLILESNYIKIPSNLRFLSNSIIVEFM